MKATPAFFHLILKIGLIAVAVLLPGKSVRGQNLFVANSEIGTITQIAPNGEESQFASGLTAIHALAWDNSQDLLYASTRNSVDEFSPGGFESAFIGGLAGKYNSLAVDSSGNLYVSDAGFLYEYSSAGVQISSVEYSYLIFAMALDSAGDLFTVNLNTNDSFLIMERMPGQAPTVFASGLDEDPGLAFNTAGDLFVSDVDTGDVYEYTPGGVQSVFASGLNLPYALAFNSVGDLFVSGYGGDDITEIAPDGTQSSFATGLYDPTGLAFEPVPEPSSPQLFAVGAIASAFAWLRRGRIRKSRDKEGMKPL